MPKKLNTAPMKKAKPCELCRAGVVEINWQNTALMQNYLSSYNKILPRKRTGNCMRHQRVLANAIKQARLLALLPFVNK